MKSRLLQFGLALLAFGLTLPASAADQAFTGTVSDSMCGAKHAMAGNAASCTRMCAGKGSKYALVVGDQVYTLETSDKKAVAMLDKEAGATVTVMGTEKDNTITVSSVKAGK
jgi:hypothetical protein